MGGLKWNKSETIEGCEKKTVKLIDLPLTKAEVPVGPMHMSMGLGVETKIRLTAGDWICLISAGKDLTQTDK